MTSPHHLPLPKQKKTMERLLFALALNVGTWLRQCWGWCFLFVFFLGREGGVGEFSDSCCMHIHNGIFTQVWMMF